MWSRYLPTVAEIPTIFGVGTLEPRLWTQTCIFLVRTLRVDGDGGFMVCGWGVTLYYTSNYKTSATASMSFHYSPNAFYKILSSITWSQTIPFKWNLYLLECFELYARKYVNINVICSPLSNSIAFYVLLSHSYIYRYLFPKTKVNRLNSELKIGHQFSWPGLYKDIPNVLIHVHEEMYFFEIWILQYFGQSTEYHFLAIKLQLSFFEIWPSKTLNFIVCKWNKPTQMS